MKAAAETTLAIASDLKRLGTRIAVTAVLHLFPASKKPAHNRMQRNKRVLSLASTPHQRKIVVLSFDGWDGGLEAADASWVRSSKQSELATAGASKEALLFPMARFTDQSSLKSCAGTTVVLYNVAAPGTGCSAGLINFGGRFNGRLHREDRR
jgi:hypothetical protein